MCKQVKISDVRCLVKQLLGIILTMDLNQLGAKLSECRDCDGLSADAAAVFSVSKNLTGDTEFRLIRNMVFYKPWQFRNAGKNCADKRLLCAGTDHFA